MFIYEQCLTVFIYEHGDHIWTSVYDHYVHIWLTIYDLMFIYDHHIRSSTVFIYDQSNTVFIYGQSYMVNSHSWSYMMNDIGSYVYLYALITYDQFAIIYGRSYTVTHIWWIIYGYSYVVVHIWSIIYDPLRVDIWQLCYMYSFCTYYSSIRSFCYDYHTYQYQLLELWSSHVCIKSNQFLT